MFSKMRFSRVFVLVAVFVVLSAIAISAAPDCHYLVDPTTTASAGIGINGVKSGVAVHDTVTIKPSDSNQIFQGVFDFYLCGPSLSGTVACTTGGLKKSITPPSRTTTAGVTFTVTSPDFNITADRLGVGRYCFRVVFTKGSTNYPSFIHYGGQTTPTDTTNECFDITSSPSAVTLSSFGAQSDALDVNNLAVSGIGAFAGLLALAGLLGAGYVVRARS